jgi:hypothetical protein
VQDSVSNITTAARPDPDERGELVFVVTRPRVTPPREIGGATGRRGAGHTETTVPLLASLEAHRATHRLHQLFTMTSLSLCRRTRSEAFLNFEEPVVPGGHADARC